MNIFSIRRFKFEYQIGLIYLLIGILWVSISDNIFDNLIDNKQLLHNIHTSKGIFYVLVTTFLLILLVRKQLRKLRKAELLAHKRNQDLTAKNVQYKKLLADMQSLKMKSEKDEFILKEAQSLAHIGNWELDLVKNKITWSDELFRIFKCNPKEFENTYEAFLNFVHPDDRFLVTTTFINHMDTLVPYNIVFRVLLSDNEVKYVNEQCKFEVDDKNKPIHAIGTIVDVTDQVISKETLKRTQFSIDNVSDCIFWIDRTAHVFFINQAVCRSLEYTMDEMLNMTIYDFDPKFPKENWDELWTELHTKGSVMIETVHRTKSGREFPVEVITNSVEYGGVKYNCAISRDITEAKENEKKLIKAKEIAEANEKKFSAITNQTTEGVALTDFNGLHVFVNPALSCITGYSESELLKMTVFDLVEKSQPASLFKDSITINSGIPIVIKIQKKDGSIINTEIVARIISINDEDFVLGIIRDITDRIKAEEALFERQEMFRALVENSADVIAKYDLNCKRTYVNPVYLKTANLPEDELLETSPTQYSPLPHKGAENLQKLIQKVIETAEPEVIDIYWPRKKEDHLWFNIKGFPEFDRDGNVKSVVAISRDITERKKTEIELAKAKDKAEESDRLKSAFLANMSHEIRTPLNGILGFSDLLKEPDLSSDQKQDYIEILRQSAYRMLNTITEIIDISRIESGQMTVLLSEIDILDILMNVKTSFQPHADEKNIHLFLKCSLLANETKTVTDSDKLNTVLNNLLNNALKYTEVGSIEFGCDLINSDKDKYYKFFVSDSGIGIAKDRHSVIFERFMQADISNKRAFQGAGLGLSVSKSFIEMLGGKIWVDSEPNKGSVFYFTLPFKQNKP